MFWAIVGVWTATSAAAFVGATYLFVLAARDWMIVGADARDMRRRLVRRETAGILARSGAVRAATTAAFTLAGIFAALEDRHDPINLVTAAIAIGLSTGTLGATVRDVIARKRIGDAS